MGSENNNKKAKSRNQRKTERGRDMLLDVQICVWELYNVKIINEDLKYTFTPSGNTSY